MYGILMMWMPSGMEWVIILVLVAMFFGLGKLPDVAKQLGAGMRDFQKSLRGEDDEDEDEGDETPSKQIEDTAGSSAKAPAQPAKSEATG